MNFLLKIAATTTAFFFIFCAPMPVDAAQPVQSGVELSSRQITNGSLLLLQIDAVKLGEPVSNLRIEYQGRRYPVYPHPKASEGKYFGLIPISFHAAAGRTALVLAWTNPAGEHNLKVPFVIVAGKYRIDELQVDSSRVTPDKKNLERARREAAKIKRIYAAGSIERGWHGGFQLPMSSEITSDFGNKRVFNGHLKSFHNGIDFRARTPSPVFAANRGIVKLAENLFYSGNAVLIDHGTGIFTIYAHLSEIDVAPGQRIEKGQRLGLTGASGRVSGPHLHWGVKVNGVAVDPFQLIEVMTSLLVAQK